jgi:hypothetical protein
VKRLALAALLLASPAGAAGFDEFQVYDGRTVEPGVPDLNIHMNAGRRGRLGDGAPRNGLLATAELGIATAPWHAVALLLPFAREFSGDTYGGGFKLRNSFVTPGADTRLFGYGLDLEIGHQSVRFAEANLALTLRPIIAVRTGPWQLILNPSVVFPLGQDGPVFAPSVRGVRQVAPVVWLGVEHYMEFGRLDRPEAPRGQSHQLFVTTDIKVSNRFALHLGLGHGLTQASDRWLGKMILSVDF